MRGNGDTVIWYRAQIMPWVTWYVIVCVGSVGALESWRGEGG